MRCQLDLPLLSASHLFIPPAGRCGLRYCVLLVATRFGRHWAANLHAIVNKARHSHGCCGKPHALLPLSIYLWLGIFSTMLLVHADFACLFSLIGSLVAGDAVLGCAR